MKERQEKIIRISPEYIQAIKRERLKRRVQKAFQETEDLSEGETKYNKEVGC